MILRKHDFLLACFLCSLFMHSSFAGPFAAVAGKPIRWNINPSGPAILVYVDATESEYKSFGSRAIEAWGSVPQSALLLGETFDQSEAQIIIHIPGESKTLPHSYAEQTFGDTNEIIGCEAHITDPTTDPSTIGVVLHEFGHCLGLGHSTVWRSVMSYRNNTELSDDDKFQLSLKYPIDGDSATPPERGCGGGIISSEHSGPEPPFGPGSPLLTWLCFMSTLAAYGIRRLKYSSN